MKPSAVLVLLGAVFGALNVVRAQMEKKYFIKDGELVLRPKFSAPITGITWKHEGNLVVEWVGSGEPEQYGEFKGIATVDVSNGELKLSKMKSSFAGRFTVEINAQDQPGGFEAVETRRVPQPQVVVRPLTCTQESQSCTFSCDGDVTGAEPVSYFWKFDAGEWKPDEKNLNIPNNHTTQEVEYIYCKVENPLSKQESEGRKNVFYTPSNVSTIVWSVLGSLLLVGVVVGAGFGYTWHEKKYCFAQTSDDPEKQTDASHPLNPSNGRHGAPGEPQNGSTDPDNAPGEPPNGGDIQGEPAPAEGQAPPENQ